MQDLAPKVLPYVQFGFHWNFLLEKSNNKYFLSIGVMTLSIFMAAGFMSMEEELTRGAAWIGIAVAYTLPAILRTRKEKQLLANSEAIGRLTPVELSLYLSAPDEERKRVVERLATSAGASRGERQGGYSTGELAIIQRAARAVWLATDGCCPECKSRRECRPVVPQEPVLPPKVKARRLKCGSKASIPHRVVGVVGPQEYPSELRGNVLYLRLWGGPNEETGSLDAVEIRPGGDFSYDHAVVAVLQRLENAGPNFCRGAAVGLDDEGDAPYYRGELPVYVFGGVNLSENTRRMLNPMPVPAAPNSTKKIRLPARKRSDVSMVAITRGKRVVNRLF